MMWLAVALYALVILMGVVTWGQKRHGWWS